MKNNKKKWVVGVSVAIIVVAVISVGIMAWEYHETPQFCATCHIMQPYLDSWSGDMLDEDGELLMAAQHQVAEVECLDCHPAEIEQQIGELTAYVGGDYSEPLKQRRFPDEFCTECHDNDDTRIEATADYEVSWKLAPVFTNKLLAAADQSWIDVNSISINPHTIGLDMTNADDPHHDGAPNPACSNCHKSHAESPQIDYCYTCHHTDTLIPCSACHSE